MSGEQAQTGMDWIQFLLYYILPSAGVGGAIGGVLSTIINHKMTLRASRKQDEMRIIEEKVRIYAFILNHLDEMKFKSDAIALRLGRPLEQDGFLFRADKDKEGKDELDRFEEEIDNKIKEQPHLVDKEIRKKWAEVKALHADPRVKNATTELRKMLADKADKITEKYLPLIKRDIISEFSPD
jgi:hypothetical protein